LQIALQPKCLIIPTALSYDAQRILKSTLRVDSANNDINALNSMGVVPDVFVNNYFTDNDAWFLRTNCSNALCWFNRENVEFTNDSDYDTDNIKHKAYMRFVPFWGDWRGLFGSAGA